MSQNRLIIVLATVLLLVMAGSVVVLSGITRRSASSPAPDAASGAGAANHFSLDVLQKQAYQLINKQLVREGALPVQPPNTVGKANPFI